MVKSKEGKGNRKICLECSKYIDLDHDHHVQLHTLNRSISPDDHAYFHFQCWVDYFNKRVENKMRANVSMMQEQALNLFNSPIIKDALSKINGSQIALNMVKMPLMADHSNLKRAIQKKILLKNDRKKRNNRKKGKTQVH
jgi:hypothetical protein